MNRIAVKIAYLGAGFSGSQIQPSLRTVEGTVLADLMKVCKMDREALDLRFSSRTDRGESPLDLRVPAVCVLLWQASMSCRIRSTLW